MPSKIDVSLYNRSQHNRSQVLEALCQRAEAHYKNKGMPFVTVTYAQSLDGSIAGKCGEQLAISCHESLVYTHALRAHHDGILVGINTILSDNPSLSTRYVDGKSPCPIVLDSRLRIPLTANVLNAENDVQPIVFTTALSGEKEQQALRNRDVRVIVLPADGYGWICLDHALTCLGQLGIRSLMVEGGGKVITSFMQSRFIDHLIITLSMKMIGGKTVLNPILAGNGYNQVFPLKFDISNAHWEGVDMILHGNPQWET